MNIDEFKGIWIETSLHDWSIFLFLSRMTGWDSWIASPTPVKDRGAWGVAVCGVAKSQAWLSDWTTTMVFKIPFNVYKTLFCDHRYTESKVNQHFLISWPAKYTQPSCPVITCLWTPSLLMHLHPRFLFPLSFTYVSRYCLWDKPPAPKPLSQDLLLGDLWAHTTSSSRKWQL